MGECKKEPGFFIFETKHFQIDLLRCKEPYPEVLEGVKEIIVTIRQAIENVKVEKRGSEVTVDAENASIGIFLTQEDTGKFSPGEAPIQVNILHNDSERDTTAQGVLKVWDNMHPEVME